MTSSKTTKEPLRRARAHRLSEALHIAPECRVANDSRAQRRLIEQADISSPRTAECPSSRPRALLLPMAAQNVSQAPLHLEFVRLLCFPPLWEVYLSPMSLDPPDITLRAYAKINLGLLVLEKRPDGFHEISTIFHRIDLADDIEIRRDKAIRVISSDEAAPSGELNICHTAVQLLQEHFHRAEGVEIRIHKRIPVGAGLGGGSSDAAVVLQTVPRLWGSVATHDELRGLALRLGSDVPYFLGDGAALAGGRGEVLEYFTLDIPYAILLCTPMISVSTRWAYAQVTPKRRGKEDLRAIVRSGMQNPQALNDQLVNDFESAVIAAHPEIRAVKESMARSGALYCSMSGSGSSVFGFFPDIEAAARGAIPLASRGYRTFITAPHFQA